MVRVEVGWGLAWPSGAPQTNAHGPWSTREGAFVGRLWGGAAIYSKENIHVCPYARVRYSATRAYAFGASDYVRRSCGALSVPALRSGLARLERQAYACHAACTSAQLSCCIQHRLHAQGRTDSGSVQPERLLPGRPRGRDLPRARSMCTRATCHAACASVMPCTMMHA